MSDAAAIRLRRQRRPPARLVYLATDYAFCLAWIAYVVGVGALYPQERALGTGFAVIWATFAALTHRDFMRTLTAWRRGEPCRPVSCAEWAFLAGQVLGALAIGLGALP